MTPEQIAEQKEVLIIEAICHQIGWDWTMDQVRQRCELVSTLNSKTQTLVIDGIPMVVFEKQPRTQLRGGDSLEVTAELRYQKLYKEKTLLS